MTDTDPRLRETPDLIGSDQVEGTTVKRSSGETIGRIERLMIEKRTGKVAYVVMTFGGFLGIGEVFVPLPWEKLTYDDHLEAYVLDVDDATLEAAPNVTQADADGFDRQRELQMYDYYGVPPYWTL